VLTMGRHLVLCHRGTLELYFLENTVQLFLVKKIPQIVSHVESCFCVTTKYPFDNSRRVSPGVPVRAAIKSFGFTSCDTP
jgi:hypothetical protein